MATVKSLKKDIEAKVLKEKEVGDFTKGFFAKEEEKKGEDIVGGVGVEALKEIVKGANKVKSESLIAVGLLAKELSLPMDYALDYVRIKDSNGEAKLFLTERGESQLAIRSGRFNVLNVIEIYEGELKRVNTLKEIIVINRNNRKSNKVIGYGGYFKLKNGFTKTIFWSKADMEREKRRFLKEGFEGLDASEVTYKKVLINFMLKNYGILDEAMKTAYINEVSVWI